MKTRLGRVPLVAVAVALVAIVALAGFGLLALGRSGSPAASGGPIAAATPTPTETPSPTPTETPSPTPSPSPTPLPYTFPIRDCKFSYSHYHHDYPANDIYVAVGCPFVAVTSGVVDEVGAVDLYPKTKNGGTRGGKFVSIIGDDGVRYYGSHLSYVAEGISPGVRVEVGTLLGLTGRTGNAARMTPHLHFGISWPTKPGWWWVRRGEVPPWSYLDAWRAGKVLSPAAAVKARHKVVGNGPCTNYC